MPLPDDSTVGARIRTARIERGMTLRELARRIGVVHSTLSDIETGRRSLRVTELMQIAAELETTPDEILSSGHISAGVAARAAEVAAETAGAAVAAWLLAVDRAIVAGAASVEDLDVFLPPLREVAVNNVGAIEQAAQEVARRVAVVHSPGVGRRGGGAIS